MIFSRFLWSIFLIEPIFGYVPNKLFAQKYGYANESKFQPNKWRKLLNVGEDRTSTPFLLGGTFIQNLAAKLFLQ